MSNQDTMTKFFALLEAYENVMLAWTAKEGCIEILPARDALRDFVASLAPTTPLIDYKSMYETAELLRSRNYETIKRMQAERDAAPMLTSETHAIVPRKVMSDTQAVTDEDIASFLVEPFELNYSNYNSDDIERLQNWAMRAHDIIKARAELSTAAGDEKRDAELIRYQTLARVFGKIIQDLTVAMQCAIIEWRHGKGAEAGLNWIENTLDGPGNYPNFDDEHGKNAQFWHDTHCSDPMPQCFCGNPSHILSMHGGFCCWEHANQANDTAIASAQKEGA